MRTHTQIIRDAGPADNLASLRGVSIHTVRSWSQRGRIPAEHWHGLVEAGLAELEELAAAAALRLPTTQPTKGKTA